MALGASSRRRRCWSARRPAALVGDRLTDEALEKLDAAARAACKPIDDKRGTIDYRVKIAGVLARRAASDRLFQGGGPLDEVACHHHRERRSGRVPLRSRARRCSTRCATSLGLTELEGGLRLWRLRLRSVIVDGRLVVSSCLMLAAEAEGKRIETIEGT